MTETLTETGKWRSRKRLSVVQVRAYKDKIETDKIGCTVFLADWLSLLPDQLTRDLLELAAEELAELAKEFTDPPRNVATWPTEALRVQKRRTSGTLTQEYFGAGFDPPFFLDRGRLRGRRCHPRPTPRTTSTWASTWGPPSPRRTGMAGTRL